MKKIVCLLFGHQWKAREYFGKDWYRECRRCGELHDSIRYTDGKESLKHG